MSRPTPTIVWGIKKGARSMPAGVAASLTFSRFGSAIVCIRHYAAPVIEAWERVAIGIDETLRILALIKSDAGNKRHNRATAASSSFGVPTAVASLLMTRGDKPLPATDVWVDGEIVYIQFGDKP